jgi:6-phosphofructokinase 1
LALTSALQSLEAATLPEKNFFAPMGVPERNTEAYSELENARLNFACPIPSVFESNFEIKVGEATSAAGNAEEIKKLFPALYGQPGVEFAPSPGPDSRRSKAINIGCVLSGGQAAGGHNCICGLFDYVEKHAPGSKVFGFLGGPKGVMENTHRILDKAFVDKYRNTGGFDMLTAGRDKIESPEQFAMAREMAKQNDLDGLVVIGGDDSNTNACVLAEDFKANGLKCSVLGLPKTIDGDLKNEYVETSFGFDTAAKVYAECVGNVQTDCMSSKKYYHFIRLMGREASHLTLEVALQTRPNMTLVGEEVRAKKLSLQQLTDQMCDMVEARYKQGKNYGVVCLPEGLIDFVPEVSQVIAQINEVLATGVTPAELPSKLSETNRKVYEFLPSEIQQQLMLDRDPHGNVQVAKIESEKLFALMVKEQLEKRKYAGKFEVQCHYFGYEGRCAPPTDFDCYYCYALGYTASALLCKGYTGMMASIRDLTKPVSEWKVKGMPLTHMMNVERRKGKDKPVIKKALTNLDGALSEPFQAFTTMRDKWMVEDLYRHPGPIQYGTSFDAPTFTLRYERLGVEAVKKDMEADHVLIESRRKKTPELPDVLATSDCKLNVRRVEVPEGDTVVRHSLPKTGGQPVLEFVDRIGSKDMGAFSPKARAGGLRVGVLFAGRQTPGAHTAVAGLHHYLKKCGGPDSKLLGFVGGTKGFFKGNAKEITDETVAQYINTGGFEMLERTADVLRGKEHYDQSAKTCQDLKLDGLCIVGGPISQCDAGLLAEELAQRNITTKVIGMPGTIDGDLRRGRYVEASFGFDTACKCYASLIGNLNTDANSARKYYYFIRVMGRSPSQIALECALQSQPTMCLVGEEFESERKTLKEIVSDIANVVAARAKDGKNFGTILVPEGLVEHIPELRSLLREISELQLKGIKGADIEKNLSPWASAMVATLPTVFKQQIMLDVDASTGSSQLTQIETERLLAELVAKEMELRAKDPSSGYKKGFAPVCFYLGYQARSALPSQFDCNLAYTVGCAAGLLINEGVTGYLATAHNLARPVKEWKVGGVPLDSLMGTGKRHHQLVPMIHPARVDLSSNTFAEYCARRESWAKDELFRNPGPIQWSGELASLISKGLEAEQKHMADKVDEVQDLLDQLKQSCGPSCSPAYLSIAASSLRSLTEVLQTIKQTEGRVQTNTSHKGGTAKLDYNPEFR